MLRQGFFRQVQAALVQTKRLSSRMSLATIPHACRQVVFHAEASFATYRPLAVPFRESKFQSAESKSPQSSLNDPAESEAQSALDEGTTRLEADDLEGARASYKRSLNILPTASAYFNLGVVYFRLSDLPKAITSFEDCVEQSPESADAHTNLASCHIMSSPSRPDLAVEHLQKATALDPQDGESWFNLGAVLEACERLEESWKAYEKSKDLGVERAEENKRNVVAKILAAKLANNDRRKGEKAAEANTSRDETNR